MKKLYPPTYFKISLAVAIILHFVYPFIYIIYSPYNYAGIVPILIGIILNIWADRLFKKHGTVISPDKKPKVLVVNGPFKLSRNPMYLGMLLALIGGSLLFGSLTSFIGPVLFFIAIQKIFIPVEEKNAGEVFGNEYKRYKQNVRQWI